MHRQRLKPPHCRSCLMRTTAMLLVLMLVSPVAATISEEQNSQINFEINGEPILPTYSRAVQLAFDRVENLDQYTQDELSQTNEWLVVTQIPIEKQTFTLAKPQSVEPTSILPVSYTHLTLPTNREV